jgi:hypothetical protein
VTHDHALVDDEMAWSKHKVYQTKVIGYSERTAIARLMTGELCGMGWVHAHLFLCMLAYYVEWHLREAWRELMFADTDPSGKATRDPVAPAHGFSTLMAELSTLVRNTCRVPGANDAPEFEVLTTPTPTQRRALDLIEQIRM